MSREEFIKRAKTIKADWLDKYFCENIEKILDSGVINLKKVEPNYHDVYPAVAAILEEVVSECIYGGSDGRRQRRKTTNIQKCVRFS